MKESKIDIAVLLIFFARPEKIRQVFESVREARPSRLYLYQDGPRPGRQDDLENIKKCREYVSNIDWECEVHYKYQEQNYGCDPSEFIAQKWMFEKEEYGIILEDDDVPSQSFFPFCKEVLEKYKNDTRFGYVCGMNHLGKYGDLKDGSYFFSQSGSIWGWATWKHVVDAWDEHYTWLDDERTKTLVNQNFSKAFNEVFVGASKRHRATGRAHYETILAGSIYLQNRLNIIPIVNMISNIGIGDNGTHAVNDIDLVPKGVRQILYMKTYELDFPLRHPKYVLEDKEYTKRVERIMGIGHPMVRTYRNFESLYYRFRKGGFKAIAAIVKKRMKRA